MPCTDPQRVEQCEVLDRLRARPVVGGHDEHRGIDLAGADEHVADQPVVAGDVDEVELGAVGQRQMRVADIDRHPAPLLLGQPVRIDPGQRPEQRRLAVVDVAGGPDDDGHAASRPVRWGAQCTRQRLAERDRRRQDRSCAGRAGPPSYSTRPTTAGRPPEAARASAVRARPGDDQPDRLEELARQRSATDRRLHLGHGDALPGGRRQSRHDRIGSPAQLLGRRGDHPPDGDVGRRAAGPIQPERRREGGQGHLLGTHGAGQRVASGSGR